MSLPEDTNLTSLFNNRLLAILAGAGLITAVCAFGLWRFAASVPMQYQQQPDQSWAGAPQFNSDGATRPEAGDRSNDDRLDGGATSPTPPHEVPAEQALAAWQQMVEVNFAGDAACADCHTREYEAHLRSGHSRTLTKMADSDLAQRLASQTYTDPLRQQTFQFELDDDRFFVRDVDRPDMPNIPVMWLLGSGTHAQTAISVDEQTQSGVEFRWSYLANKDALGTTPDHERFNDFREGTIECFGRPLDSAGIRGCLACHTTLNPPPQLPILDSLYVANVGCERCHGPRKKHVEQAYEGLADETKPLLRYETAAAYMDACAQCHRDESRVSADQPAHELVRFQPYGLKRSRCYLESPGNMTCSTCHDPHDTVSSNRVVYREQCQQCHQPGTPQDCPKLPTGDCVECHMPAVEWTAGISFHDHWIRVQGRDVPGDSPDQL